MNNKYPVFLLSVLFLATCVVGTMFWVYRQTGPANPAAETAVQPLKKEVTAAPEPPTAPIKLAPTALPVTGVAAAEPAVALTFDSNLGNSGVPLVLDLLEKHGVHATFFISGPWAEAYPEETMRLVSGGHELGNHGYAYQPERSGTVEGMKQDLAQSAAAIQKVAGVTVRLYRPAGGQFTPAGLQAAAELGYRSLAWEIDAIDHGGQQGDAIVGRVLQQLKPGAVIRMRVDDAQSADALDKLLPRILWQGYRIMPAGELLQRYGAQEMRYGKEM